MGRLRNFFSALAAGLLVLGAGVPTTMLHELAHAVSHDSACSEKISESKTARIGGEPAVCAFLELFSSLPGGTVSIVPLAAEIPSEVPVHFADGLAKDIGDILIRDTFFLPPTCGPPRRLNS